MPATPRQLTADALFQVRGYPPESAAAWVGNFSQEVGVNLPSAFRRGKLDHGSQGLEQARLDRLTRYEDWVDAKHPECKNDPAARWAWYGNMALQVEYADIECQRSFPAVYAALKKGGNIDELTALICWKFEIPSKKYANLAFRQAQARLVFTASNHIAVPSPATKSNTDAIAAKKAVVQSNSSAGIGVVLGGAVAALHWAGGMPTQMAWVAAGIVSAVVIYSLVRAQTATAAAGKAALQGTKAIHEASVGTYYTTQEPVGSGATLTPVVVTPGLPEPPPEPEVIPTKPTTPAEWVYSPLGWIMGEAPPKSPEPAAPVEEPESPTAMKGVAIDLPRLAKLIASALSADLDLELASTDPAPAQELKT